MAQTRKAAEVAFDPFVASYGLKNGKAVDKLTKDKDALFAFHDFPAENWTHIRTTNPVESRVSAAAGLAAKIETSRLTAF